MGGVIVLDIPLGKFSGFVLKCLNDASSAPNAGLIILWTSMCSPEKTKRGSKNI